MRIERLKMNGIRRISILAGVKSTDTKNIRQLGNRRPNKKHVVVVGLEQDAMCPTCRYLYSNHESEMQHVLIKKELVIFNLCHYLTNWTILQISQWQKKKKKH